VVINSGCNGNKCTTLKRRGILIEIFKEFMYTPIVDLSQKLRKYRRGAYGYTEDKQIKGLARRIEQTQMMIEGELPSRWELMDTVYMTQDERNGVLRRFHGFLSETTCSRDSEYSSIDCSLK